jgi:hypothetical protein
MSSIFKGKAFGMPKDDVQEEYSPRLTPGEKVLDSTFGSNDSISSFSSGKLESFLYGMKKTDMSSKLGAMKGNTNFEKMLYGETSGAKMSNSLQKMLGNKKATDGTDKIRAMIGTSTKTDKKESFDFHSKINNFLVSSSVRPNFGKVKSASQMPNDKLNRMLGGVPTNLSGRITSKIMGEQKLRSMLGTQHANLNNKMSGDDKLKSLISSNTFNNNKVASDDKLRYMLGNTTDRSNKLNYMLGKTPNVSMTFTADNKLNYMLGKTANVNTQVAGEIKIRSLIGNHSDFTTKILNETRRNSTGVRQHAAETFVFNGKRLSMFGDYDKDGVMNILDCNPLDRRKQGADDEVEKDTFVDLKNLSGTKFETYGEVEKPNIEVYGKPKTSSSSDDVSYNESFVSETVAESEDNNSPKDVSYENAYNKKKKAPLVNEIYDVVEGKREKTTFEKVKPVLSVVGSKVGAVAKTVGGAVLSPFKNVAEAGIESLKYNNPLARVKRDIEDAETMRKAEKAGKVLGRLDYVKSQAVVEAQRQANLQNPKKNIYQLAYAAGIPQKDVELQRFYAGQALFGKGLPRELKAGLWETLAPNVSSGSYFGNKYINPMQYGQMGAPKMSSFEAASQRIKELAGGSPASGASGGFSSIRAALSTTGNEMDKLTPYLRGTIREIPYTSQVEESITRGVQGPEQQVVVMERPTESRELAAINMSRQVSQQPQEVPLYAPQQQIVPYVQPTSEDKLYSPYSRRYVSVVRGPYKKTYGYNPKQANAQTNMQQMQQMQQ